MNPITSLDDIGQLGTIVGIWAHPDDETFTCGGILAAAAANGQRVVCITATKGEAGSQDEERWPLATIGGVRAAEMQQALKVLGIKEHHWLGYRDGRVPQADPEEAVAKILTILEGVQVDTFITFPTDGITGHTDHIAVSSWADQVAQRLGKPVRIFHATTLRELHEQYFDEADRLFNIYFMIDKPALREPADCTICVKLPSEIVDKKIRALTVMPSQYEKFLAAFSHEWAEGALGTEALVETKKGE